MKGRLGEYPFDNYMVYDMFDKRQNRKMIILVDKNNRKNRTTITLAKYLLSIHLGRILTREETVDHIDDDKTNDSLENLQVLSLWDNRDKYLRNTSYLKTIFVFKCPNCNKIFERDKRRSFSFLNKKIRFTTCSIDCRNSLLSKIMLGENVDFSDNFIETVTREVYYKN